VRTREFTPDAKGKRVWPCDVKLPTALWRWETGCWGSLDGCAVGDGGGCLVSKASAGFPGVGEFWGKGRRAMGRAQRRVRRIRLGLSPSSVPVPVQSRFIGNTCSAPSPTGAESSPSGKSETEWAEEACA
jgi:hypothetical protein